MLSQLKNDIEETEANGKIENRSLSEQLFDHMKKMILSRELKGGQRISEEEMAMKFGLSRTPVREASRRLEEYGLINIKPRSYAEIVKIDPSEAKQIAMVRAELECLVVRLLAEKGDKNVCSNLKTIVGECEKIFSSGDMAGTFEKDSQFHLEMARSTGNKYLFNIMDKFDPKVQLFRIEICTTKEKIRENNKLHNIIVELIYNKDVEKAVSIMRQHIMVGVK